MIATQLATDKRPIHTSVTGSGRCRCLVGASCLRRLLLGRLVAATAVSSCITDITDDECSTSRCGMTQSAGETMSFMFSQSSMLIDITN